MILSLSIQETFFAGFLCWLSHLRSREIWLRTNAVSSLKITASRKNVGYGARKCSFLATCVGYFAFERLLRCSDDRTLPLAPKIRDSIGFRAANRLRVDKVRSDRRLFFLCCLYFVFWREWQGSHNNSQKTRLNRWIHTKKHRNTSKVSLLYIFYGKKSKNKMIFSVRRPRYIVHCSLNGRL